MMSYSARYQSYVDPDPWLWPHDVYPFLQPNFAHDQDCINEIHIHFDVVIRVHHHHRRMSLPHHSILAFLERFRAFGA